MSAIMTLCESEAFGMVLVRGFQGQPYRYWPMPGDAVENYAPSDPCTKHCSETPFEYESGGKCRRLFLQAALLDLTA